MPVLDTEERPIPPTEIVRRLQQIDPRLGLVYSSTVDPATDRLRDTWALTMGWLPTDKRWELVQRGDMSVGGTFDVLCWLPFDCSVDEAYGYVVSRFKQLNDREDMKALLERVHTYNAEARQAALKEPTELMDDLFETNRLTLRPGSTKAVSSPISQHKVENKRKKANEMREYMEQ